MNGKARAWGWSLGCLLVCALCSTPAPGADWRKGKWFINWDNTLTYGLSYRLDDPDPEIIGLPNGGSAFSVNGDDGNLNYEAGIWSNIAQLTTELEAKTDRFGLFARGWGFYDYENEDNDRARTPLVPEALDRVGSRFELRDAYAWFKFRLGKRPAELRAGRQVLNWGESTFIQGGINIINPVDVTALRSPGSELRNALLPVGMVSGSFALSTNTTLELFYEYEWEEIKIDPPGSYFSTNDFVGEGGELVYLGFGSSPDVPPYPDPSDTNRPFLAVRRAADLQPEDGGQYGAALRWLVPGFGDTEFGLYFVNYHSRVPTINGITGTVAGAVTAATIGAAATPIVTEVLTQLAGGATIPEAVAAGTAVGVGAGAPLGASQAIAGTAATNLSGVGSVTTAFATDAYAQTARYFLEYPEDIKLYGLSFNAQIGTTGLAWQGELSYRQDAPLQIDDVELLFAALEPINPAFAAGPGASQITSFTGVNYSTLLATPVPGYIVEDTAQFQTTLTKIWPQVLGADQVLLLFEGAVTYVPDMPDKDELRLEVAGTYTSGNPYHQEANPGAAHVGKPAETAEHYADPTSWGYRLVTRLQYNNAIGAITLSPRLAWGHDVSGNSPGPGGNFLEDRKAVTLGLTFDYQSRWAVDLSYTDFFGAGRYNLINDRDYVAASFKYSF